jgi:hypothetical protein
LSIVRQRWLMKAFAAIKFKQKWMMPLCFPNHLASDWYLTLNAQIDLWMSNRLVNVSHLTNFPRQFFSSVFLLAKFSNFGFYSNSLIFRKKKLRIGSNIIFWNLFFHHQFTHTYNSFGEKKKKRAFTVSTGLTVHFVWKSLLQ